MKMSTDRERKRKRNRKRDRKTGERKERKNVIG